MPLLSFCGILLVPGKTSRGSYFSIFNIFVSLVLSAILFISIWNKAPVHQQIEWFTIGTAHFKFGILLNNLSVLMMLLVSVIASLVHIYSTRYMEHDPYIFRYWAYLGLFCFSMFGLVITDNLLILYMFWELVGFSSYLLIGFWFTRDTAVQANKKAFIMNRLGDLGFLTGIMIVFSQFHTLDIQSLFHSNGLVSQAVILNGDWIAGGSVMPAGWLTFAGLAFFFGATAKSAQFPLHTWLPDAMEGPTSVSSLIHAATMVAAGVFLLGRIYPLFNDTVLLVIAGIGAFTAFMAGSIAVTQNDIKRILAFSTISQLGFMMLAMGVGAYSSAIFHLVTHAFFKCLLFLAAGAVIHEMHHYKEKHSLAFDHQDIRNMGGLRRFMPITFVTMALASLALAGIPFSSGYLSKDAILIQSFEWAETRSPLAWLIPYSALLTSWLTAFYIARLVFKVFFGQLRVADPAVRGGLHEAPSAMKNVLLVLAVFCLFPVFSLNPFGYEESWLLRGLAAVRAGHSAFHTIIPLAVSVVALLLITLAYSWYAKRKEAPDFSSSTLFRFSRDQWYFDKIYTSSFVNGILFLSRAAFRFDKKVVDGIVDAFGKAGLILSAVSNWIDKYIVDGLVNGAGALARSIGNFARHFQTGRLQHYLITMLLVVLSFFIIKYFS